jgi:thiol-disulfide isomerase/thioredoxin
MPRPISPGLAILFVASSLSAAQLVPLDGSGYARMLREHRGKVVLVDFWASWCDQCREELPKLIALAKKLGPAKFNLITVSADEPEQEHAARDFLDKQGAPSPRYIKHSDDDQLFIDSIDKKWSGALPALFLYDSSGALIKTFIGDAEPPEIEQAIRRAIR